MKDAILFWHERMNFKFYADDTKKSFLDLYTKVDAGVSIEELNQGSSNDDEELIQEDE